jgi:hypothetical protein
MLTCADVCWRFPRLSYWISRPHAQ